MKEHKPRRDRKAILLHNEDFKSVHKFYELECKGKKEKPEWAGWVFDKITRGLRK